MAEVTNNFLGSKMNKDVNGRLIPKGEYRDMLNCRVDSDSNDGEVEKVLGPELIAATGLAAGSTIIGYKKHKGYHYYFAVTDTGNDVIGRINDDTEVNQVIINVSYLDFNVNNRIIDINFIDDEDEGRLFMYWVDGINPPRYFNILQAISSPGDFVNANSFSVIKAPPKFAPKFEFVNSFKKGAFNLTDKIYKFSYRYIYESGEKSTLSFQSGPAFFDDIHFEGSDRINTSGSTYVYFNRYLKNAFNALRIIIKVDNEHSLSPYVNIDKIEVFANEVGSTTFKKIKEITHDKTSIEYSFLFMDDDVYPVLSDQTASQPFDNVPKVPNNQEIIDSVLLYGDYIDGYDSIPITSDVEIVKKNDDHWISFTGESSVTTTELRYSDVSLSPTEKGVIFVFDIDLFTPLPVGSNNFRKVVNIVLDDDYTNFSDAVDSPTSGIKEAFLLKGLIITSETSGILITLDSTMDASFGNTQYAYIFNEYNTISLRPGQSYEYAITYFDEFNRSGPTNSIGIFESPALTELSSVSRMARVEISNTAPTWAKKFKISRRQYNYSFVNIIPEAAEVYDNKIYIKLRDDDSILVSDESVLIELLSRGIYNTDINFSEKIIKVESTDASHSLGAGRWIVINDTGLDGYTSEDIENSLAQYVNSQFNVYSGLDGESVFFKEIPGDFYIDNNGYHIDDDIISDSYGIDQNQTAAQSFVKYIRYDGDIFIHPGIGGSYVFRYETTDASKLSPLGRASIEIENFKETRRFASVTYSQPYVEETGFNGLSSFNTALVNYKDYDVRHGAIKKIHSRDTDLVIFQEDKVIAQPFKKNLLFTVGGGGSVTSTDGVLEQHAAYAGEFGMSHKESFAFWDKLLFWIDAKRGVVLRLDINGLFPISSHGMKDFFYNLFDQSPDFNYKGAFLKDKNEYVLNIDNNYSHFYNYKTSGWTHRQGLVPDVIGDDGLNLFCFKDRSLYRNEKGSICDFFGDQQDASIEYFINEGFGKKKVLKSLTQQGDAWDVRIESEDGTRTKDLSATDFENKEGFWYKAVGSSSESTERRSHDIGGLGEANTDSLDANVIIIPVEIPSLCVGNQVRLPNNTLVGTVTGIDGVRITLDTPSALTDEFLIYTKASEIEGSVFRDHIFKIILSSSGSTDDKIFAVDAELFQSNV